jgi:hypothetical protein
MKKLWTEDEIKTLTENYSKCFSDEMMRLLPDRTLSVIWSKASSLKLKCHRKSNIERFNEKTVLNLLTGCWEWTACLNKAGYGWFRHSEYNKPILAHRFIYEYCIENIGDLTLDHLCRNRKCVNPDHLEPVTLAVNKERGMSFAAINARKTHCIHGHAFTPENIVPNKYNYRICRECCRIKNMKYYNQRVGR